MAAIYPTWWCDVMWEKGRERERGRDHHHSGNLVSSSESLQPTDMLERFIPVLVERWNRHRKEPTWVVGEHRQFNFGVLLVVTGDDGVEHVTFLLVFFTVSMHRPGTTNFFSFSISIFFESPAILLSYITSSSISNHQNNKELHIHEINMNTYSSLLFN